MEFFRFLLSPEDTHHLTSESAGRIAEYSTKDLIFRITRGTFLSLKHTSVGLGLHDMVGQKLPVDILSQ